MKYLMPLLFILVLFGCKLNGPVPAEEREDAWPSFSADLEARNDAYLSLPKHPDYRRITAVAIKFADKVVDCHYSLDLEVIRNGWARCDIQTVGVDHRSCGAWQVFLEKKDGEWIPRAIFPTDGENYQKYLDAFFEDAILPCFIMRGATQENCDLIAEYQAKKKELGYGRGAK